MIPKISVIVPVYNTEKYLEECLNSILTQSLKEIEIIVVNDASPDHSGEIVRRLAKADDRIVFLEKPVNEGVGAARNDGIRRAAGEYICFMDSDDLYPNTEALQRLYQAAEENHVSVSGGGLEAIREGAVERVGAAAKSYGMEFRQQGLMDYREYQYDYGYTCYLYSRALLVENDIWFPRYSRFQDPPFFVRAMYAAGKYYYIDHPVYRYRILNDSAKYTIRKASDMLSGVMDNLAFSKEKGLAKLHYLSACRLDQEVSFSALQNLLSGGEGAEELFAKLIRANNAVDTEWLKEQGYALREPFVCEALEYTFLLAKKYNTLRNNKFVRMAKRLIK